MKNLLVKTNPRNNIILQQVLTTLKLAVFIFLKLLFLIPYIIAKHVLLYMTVFDRKVENMI